MAVRLRGITAPVLPPTPTFPVGSTSKSSMFVGDMFLLPLLLSITMSQVAAMESHTNVKATTVS
jgi:hypothetical protein